MAEHRRNCVTIVFAPEAWHAQLCNGTDSLLIAWQNWNPPHLITTVVFWAPVAVSSPEVALALSEFQHMAPDRGPRVQASQLEYAPLVTPDWEWVQLYRRNGRNSRQPWVPSALLPYAQCRLKGASAHASQNWAIHRTSQPGRKRALPSSR